MTKEKKQQNKLTTKLTKWNYVYLIVMVVAPIGWAIIWICMDLIFINNSVLLEGKVVGIVEQFEDNGLTSQVDWYLQFEYEYQGQKFLQKSMLTMDPPIDSSNGLWEEGERVEFYNIGETMDVYIKPNNPNDFLLSTFENRWFWPLFLGGFGIVIGVFYFRNL